MPIKYFKHHETNDLGVFRVLLTPSWLSGLIAIVIGLVVTAGVIVAFSFTSSEFSQQLATWQQTRVKPTPVLTTVGQAPPTVENASSLQSNWPLLAVWGFIGLAVYFIAVEIIGVIRTTSEIRAEMDYVNIQRESLLKDTLAHLGLRLGALALWLGFTILFFKRLIPDAIAAAHQSASHTSTFYGLAQALLAFAIVVISLHLHAVFLRLTLRRARAFSSSPIA